MPDQEAADPSPPAAQPPLDFTAQDPPPPDKLAGPPPDKPFDPEPAREKVRAGVTYLLTMFVCLYSAAALVSLALDWISVDDIDGVVLFFTPLITLTGTALGFYFGGKPGR